MNPSTDIQGLQDIIGTSFGEYHEIVRDEKSVNCQARWPLLAQTQSLLSSAAAAVTSSILKTRNKDSNLKNAPILTETPNSSAESTNVVPTEQAVHPLITIGSASASTSISKPEQLAVAASSKLAEKTALRVVVPSSPPLDITPAITAAFQSVATAKVLANIDPPVLTRVVARSANSFIHPLLGGVKPKATAETNNLIDLFMRLEACPAQVEHTKLQLKKSA